MSLIEHLVDRALDRGRAVAPIHDLAPIGAKSSAPDPTPGFEEIHVEVPASGSSSVHPGMPVSPRSSASPTNSREVLRRPSSAIPASPIAPPQREPLVARETSPQPSSRSSEREVEVRTVAANPARAASPSAVMPAERNLPPRSPASSPDRSEPVLARSSVAASPTIARAIEPARVVTPIAAPTTSAPRIEALASSARTDIAPQGSSAAAGPTLRIEIGRVIVHAPQPASEPRAASRTERTTTSLADYLAGRERGQR